MKKTVNLMDGKYTITFDESTGVMKFLRYSEEWPAGDELRHTNVVAALVQRVIELEEKNTTHVAIPIKIDAKDAIQAVDGMSDLVIAAIDYVNNGHDGTNRAGSYVKIQEALDKIAERHILDDMSFDPVPPMSQARFNEKMDALDKINPEPLKKLMATPIEGFFKLDGVAKTPDIEEDFGRLLVKVRTAFDFIANGPVMGLQLPQEEIDKKFNDIVVSLIPAIDTIMASRVMVKHPFAILADLFSKGGAPSAVTGVQRYVHGVGKMLETCDALARANPKTDAVEVMDCLAYIATYMQVIMNLYGWTWDDVKLKARQQMATSETDRPS